MSHYQTFAQFNQSGLAGLLTYPAHIVPIFIPLVLFALFIVTLMGTFFSQQRLSTRGGDWVSSFAVACFFVGVIAYMMSLVEGLINLPTLTVAIGIGVLGLALLLYSKDRD